MSNFMYFTTEIIPTHSHSIEWQCFRKRSIEEGLKTWFMCNTSSKITW